MTKGENVHEMTPEPVIHHHNAKKSDKKNMLAIPIAIVIAGLLISTSIILTNKGGSNTANTANAAAVVDENLTIRENDHILGNKDADVVLFVWSDPECPYCKRYHDTLKSVLNKYQGKIAIVYRHFALDFHTYAKKEAESMECANEVGGADGFTKYMNQLFEVTEGNNSLNREKLTKIATQAGLDTAKFDACVDSDKFATRVQEDIESGIAAGVNGTPFSVAVNKKTGRQSEINGALPIEMVSAKLNVLMK